MGASRDNPRDKQHAEQASPGAAERHDARPAAPEAFSEAYARILQEQYPEYSWSSTLDQPAGPPKTVPKKAEREADWGETPGYRP
jgi:hypothetical protein